MDEIQLDGSGKKVSGSANQKDENGRPFHFKGKPKMDLDKYYQICRSSLKSHLHMVENAPSQSVKVKYQAIINSLLLRLKRREDETTIEENYRR